MALGSDPNNQQPPASQLYQYAVPAALFLIAALIMSFYFRSRARSDAARQHELADIIIGLRSAAEYSGPLVKPILFDAWFDPASSQKHWEEMIPLAARVFGHPPDSVPDKTLADDTTNSEPIPTRLVLEMLILMPSPTPPNLVNADDEPILPYLELGVLETNVRPPTAIVSS
uniref:Uncharacterized protein n=1 Tax=Mycena chlorophos TaxID=658473 RepID=A0ABQ0LWQ6_MYCCL|nr:predicted protein [Mycena chlorophos]